ncbi:uncharacterized protein K441DRAFT_688154 [Cenococcum geophilum 1.58]|uniref:uncharacterized protein n=1 Tax=Cenococcum geophilum 1.58 TaxID=794803 RepID=UPI00358E5629|nr:hypothetical protein K441DRAFT_688154 [Cenococcum geophilum 1.58]
MTIIFMGSTSHATVALLGDRCTGKITIGHLNLIRLDLIDNHRTNCIVARDTSEPTRQPLASDAIANDRRRKSVNDQVVTGAGEITTRQSVIPVTLVTVLFFMWRFAYGLPDVLNKHFQEVLHGAYFGAYFIGPLMYSGCIVHKFGYRWTFITGLCISGRSFDGFYGSMFIVGSGLSTLETSANPFIATCGPPRWSELRLNLPQAFQAIGTVVAPVLASYVLFKNVSQAGDTSLQSIQWVYLGAAIFVISLAVVFFFAPIPEVTDADMAAQAETTTDATRYTDKRLRHQYTLSGAASTFRDRPFLRRLKAVKPRYILFTYMSGIIVFIAAAIGTKGNTGIAMLSLVLFFESCIFSKIFTLSLRGLGRHTKRGAPPPPRPLRIWIAMCVPLVSFLITRSLPICLNLIKAKEFDGLRESRVGIEGPVDVESIAESYHEKDMEAARVEVVAKA